MSPRVRILTYGCQMNEADSLALEERLAALGYRPVAEVEEADVVLLNTCSVRRKAEDRVFGVLSHLKTLKEKRRGSLVVGVVGCMAEAARAELAERCPYVDFVLGPDELDRVPAELASRLELPLAPAEGPLGELPADPYPFKRYVPIMRGCDNFCAYCIVPHTRGRERSVPASEVEAQVGGHADAGVVEITLLGQNVNSYRADDTDFPTLLRGLADRWPEVGFRLLTSHPKDLSDELIEVFGTRENVLPHLHLPLQAGNDRILALMNRRYTVAHYRDRVARLRAARPDLALTTDLICGFPTETEEEFEDTLRAVDEIRFDSAFMFHYSVRPGTAAAAMGEDPPPPVRKERLRRLIDLQQVVSRDVNRASVGREMTALVEKPARRGGDLMAARTGSNKTILVSGGADLVGRRVRVVVETADAWTLTGRITGGVRR